MSATISRRHFAATAAVASLLATGHRALAQPATPVADPGASVASAIDALPSFVEGLQASTGVPGIAIAVVHNDEVVYTGGFGERVIDSGEPVTDSTVFQIASISKSLSSTIVSSLLDDLGLTWDTRIIDLDPSFALADPWVTANVTLADLFSHRSGLPDHAADELEDLGADRDLVLERLRHVPLEGRFRDSYAYTNFGLTAAAEAIARYLDTTWEELADTTLFGPLDMVTASYRHSDYASRDDRALLHVQQDDAWVQAFDRQPDPQAPAGGVSASVVDLAQWMRLILGNGVLDGDIVVPAEPLEYSHLPHSRTSAPEQGVPNFYGLGWNVGYTSDGQLHLGHSGAFALGASTAVNLWPSDALGIITLTNGEPLGVPETINATFGDLARFGAVATDYYSLINPIITSQLVPPYGHELDTLPVDITPPSGPEAYTGTYGNDLFGDLEITAEGDALSMTVGPAGMTFPLHHISRDVFAYTPVGENGGMRSAVTFTIGAGGAATQVVVGNLDTYDAGTFTRD